MGQSVRYVLTSGFSPIEFRKVDSFSALVANLQSGLAQ